MTFDDFFRARRWSDDVREVFGLESEDYPLPVGGYVYPNEWAIMWDTTHQQWWTLVYNEDVMSPTLSVAETWMWERMDDADKEG